MIPMNVMRLTAAALLLTTSMLPSVSAAADRLLPAQTELLEAKLPVTAAYVQTGEASWYEDGTKTASLEHFNPEGMTAAHLTLPFGTVVKVVNLKTGKAVTVTINDRGPHVKGRIIDLSRGAARKLGMIASGTAQVGLIIVGAQVEG